MSGIKLGNTIIIIGLAILCITIPYHSYWQGNTDNILNTNLETGDFEEYWDFSPVERVELSINANIDNNYIEYEFDIFDFYTNISNTLYFLNISHIQIDTPSGDEFLSFNPHQQASISVNNTETREIFMFIKGNFTYQLPDRLDNTLSATFTFDVTSLDGQVLESYTLTSEANSDLIRYNRLNTTVEIVNYIIIITILVTAIIIWMRYERPIRSIVSDSKDSSTSETSDGADSDRISNISIMTTNNMIKLATVIFLLEIIQNPFDVSLLSYILLNLIILGYEPIIAQRLISRRNNMTKGRIQNPSPVETPHLLTLGVLLWLVFQIPTEQSYLLPILSFTIVNSFAIKKVFEMLLID